MYVILFRYFISGVGKFILLIIVFIAIAADYFYIIGRVNTKIDPLTGEYYPTLMSSLYTSARLSIQWGMLASDDTSAIS